MNDRDKQMNNKKDEALKLALEALNKSQPIDSSSVIPHNAHCKAITAIREALAEQDSKEKEQSKTDAFIKQIDEALAEQPAQQEPVANYCKECLTYNGHHEGCSHYTTPPAPASKPWVGMTDEEINEFFEGMEPNNGFWLSFARAIEAKLKEKNA